MTNYGHELFLLSNTISQVKNRELIKKLFIDCINKIFTEFSFTWVSDTDTPPDRSLSVKTENNTYGYLAIVEKHQPEESTVSLLHNAIQLLAIHLEKLDQELLLQDQTAHLNHLVDERTQQLTQEIEERKKIEEELKESELKFKNIVETTSDWLWEIDAGGTFTYVSPRSIDILGYQPEELIGKNTFSLMSDEEAKRVDSVYSKFVEEKTGFKTMVNKNLHKDGHEIIIESSGVPILAENGELIGYRGIDRDVTEVHALQAQLNQSQKLDAIGQLAGGIAHDFNNMLGGIMGGAQLLKSKMNPDEKNMKYLKLVMDSAERAADLTTKLVSFSRKQAPNNIPIDIHSIIPEAISLLENSLDKRINISTDLSATSSVIMGETSQIQNIFINLGINASHVMLDGGELAFTTKVLHLTDADCAKSSFNLRPGSYIEIAISDNGHGIDKTIISHIFDPFFTTKEQGKGTGLGLSVVYGAVQQHDGAITVESTIGEGSTFSLLFPLTDIKTKRKVPPHGLIRGSGTILLVDDEPIMREVGRTLLKECGYRVLLAENGEAAVTIYKKYPDEIKLVVLDMIMPVMNGADCFTHLRTITPTLPIILVSGFSNSTDLQDLMEQGCNGFMQKPYNGNAFSKVVSEAIELHQD